MFVPVFAGSTSDATVKLCIPERDAIASSNPTFAQTGGAIATAIDTKTMRLDEILDQAGITQVDFLSMDIELAEPEALAGFTLERYGIQLACIEGHPQVRQQIIDYFTARATRSSANTCVRIPTISGSRRSRSRTPTSARLLVSRSAEPVPHV